jgi:ATP-binding cassette subfamily B protein
MRVQAYAKLQSARFEVLDQQRAGGLATVLNDDVTQSETFLRAGAHDLVQLVTNLIIVGPVFYFVAPGVAYVAVLAIPFLVSVSFGYVARTALPYLVTRRKAAALNDQLVTNIGGVAVIRSFTTEDHERARIAKLSTDYQVSSDFTDQQTALLSPSIRLVLAATWASQIVIGGFRVLRHQMDAGTFTTLVALTQRFLWPIIRLGKVVDDYQKSMASATRVFELIDLPAETAVPANGGPVHPVPAGAAIAFENVSFSYMQRAPALRNLSMEFPAGKVTAIVGPTGAGKSTIVKLLLRFYDVNEGRITIGGVDIRDMTLHDLRHAIAVVGQDSLVFAGTIADNIRYGSFAADDAAIVQAARLAEIDGFINELPAGYASPVGESGVNLSGGQRQRLSLARSFLKDAPILVLDEATSAVDYETEHAIQHALRHVSKQRTMIVIAHRLTTIRHADLVYVLDGTVVEQGTHDQLLQRGGLYASLWALQTGDEPDASAILPRK